MRNANPPLLVAAIAASTALAAASVTDCKSFSCEDLGNCPRTDGSGGDGSGGAGNGAGGSAGSGADGGGGSGNTCMGPDDCGGGPCVDGFCCDSPCDGLCQSCAVSGSEGSCADAPAASNDDMECGAGVCDGSGNCAVGSHLASTHYGHMNGNEHPNGMGVNDAGEVAIAGSATGYTVYGGGPWSSSGPADSDAFIAHYNSDLGHEYSAGYVDLNDMNQSGYDAIVDSSGYLVTTGTFEGPTYFLNSITLTQSTGYYNMFISRVTPTGTTQWAKDYGSDPGYQTPKAIVVNPQGDIFVTGHFEDSIHFGSPEGQLDASGFLQDVFVARINTNGEGVWARRYGDEEHQYAYDIALDNNGNVLLTGRYDGTINFGGNTLLDEDGYDGFVVKLDSDGNHLWSNGYGGADDQEPQQIAADGEGNVIVAGEVSGQLDFGDGPLPGGSYDVFVAKLDPNGNHIWSHRYSTNYQDRLTGLAVDSAGNVIITGTFYLGFDCGGGVLDTQNDQNMYICKLSKDGVHLWSRGLGDDQQQQPVGVGVDGLDNIYLAGNFQGSIDFGGGPINDAGMGGIFLAKLSP